MGKKAKMTNLTQARQSTGGEKYQRVMRLSHTAEPPTVHVQLPPSLQSRTL